MSHLVYRDGQFYREDDYLAHYGVKGMKWGVRKARDIGSTAKAVGKVLNRNRKRIYQDRIDRSFKRKAAFAKYSRGVAVRGALMAGTAIAARRAINKRNVQELHTNRDRRYSREERNYDILRNKPKFYSGEKFAAKVNANIRKGMNIEDARTKARESVRNGRVIAGLGAAATVASLYTNERGRKVNAIVNRASDRMGQKTGKRLKKAGKKMAKRLTKNHHNPNYMNRG